MKQTRETTSLVDRDSPPRWAWGLDVQFDVGKLCFVEKRSLAEKLRQRLFSLAPRVQWLACRVQSGGAVVDRQFRAIIFPVTLRGLKIDGDGGVGMSRAKALHVARRGAGGELVDGVEGVAGPTQVQAGLIPTRARRQHVADVVVSELILLAGHGRAVGPVSPPGFHMTEAVVLIDPIRAGLVGNSGVFGKTGLRTGVEPQARKEDQE